MLPKIHDLDDFLPTQNQAQFLSVEELAKATSAAAATNPDDSLTTRLVR